MRQSPQLTWGQSLHFLWKNMEHVRGNHHEIKGVDQGNLEYNMGKVGLPVRNVWRFYVI